LLKGLHRGKQGEGLGLPLQKTVRADDVFCRFLAVEIEIRDRDRDIKRDRYFL
jgi:hypothetical protein